MLFVVRHIDSLIQRSVELPALSVSESYVKPTTMLYRNMLAMETEELLRSLFGRDLSQQQLVDDGMNILQKRVSSLAEVYKKIEAKR